MKSLIDGTPNALSCPNWVTERPPGFCPRMRPVLDCANGYQKENQEEVDEVEEECRPEGKAHEEAGKKGENSQEIGQEESRAEQSGSEKEEAEKSGQREDCERA